MIMPFNLNLFIQCCHKMSHRIGSVVIDKVSKKKSEEIKCESESIVYKLHNYFKHSFYSIYELSLFIVMTCNINFKLIFRNIMIFPFFNKLPSIVMNIIFIPTFFFVK